MRSRDRIQWVSQIPYFMAPNNVFDIQLGLNPTDKLVYICLMRYANDVGKCWPGYKTIARNCEVNERTARRAVERLVQAGFIKKELRQENGQSKSNLYTVYHPHEVINRGDTESTRRGTQSPGGGDTESTHGGDTESTEKDQLIKYPGTYPGTGEGQREKVRQLIEIVARPTHPPVQRSFSQAKTPPSLKPINQGSG